MYRGANKDKPCQGTGALTTLQPGLPGSDLQGGAERVVFMEDHQDFFV